MFKKWATDSVSPNPDDNGSGSVITASNETQKKNETESVEKVAQSVNQKPVNQDPGNNNTNTILKGSKLTGDINVTCDLDLGGDIEGNIRSEKNSNIIIRGVCKGNIETREGDVEIRGELKGGNISAGKNVTIIGKFNGGEAKAGGKVYVDGEFNGKLEGNEIEIGSNSKGKGELFYTEYIAIARGAKVEVQITRVQEDIKPVKNSPEKKVIEMKPPVKDFNKVNPVKEVKKINN